jgi:hypothetical protein
MIQGLILFTNGILTVNASTFVISFFDGLIIIIIIIMRVLLCCCVGCVCV